jgi:hypothetical protein
MGLLINIYKEWKAIKVKPSLIELGQFNIIIDGNIIILYPLVFVGVLFLL